jgi:hypothetical protein
MSRLRPRRGLIDVAASAPGIRALTLTGEPAGATVEHLALELAAAYADRESVVVDLSGATVLDAEVLRTIARAHDQVTHVGRRLVLVLAATGLPAEPDLDALLEVVPHAPTRDAAVRLALGDELLA